MKSYPAILLLLIISSCSFFISTQDAAKRVRVSAGVSAALRETMIDPVYPPLARQARIEGVVTLKLLISKAGDVEDVQLMSGHPMLGPAAIAAVRQWKYKPYLLNGDPIDVETTAQVKFTLIDKPGNPVAANPSSADASNTSSKSPLDESASSSEAKPLRVRVSQGIVQGLLVKRVNPEYPPDAREQGIQGVVLLQVVIEKEGNITEAKLISGHPLLAPAAIEAVKQWKYRPFLLNGEAVDVQTQIQVNFKLEP